MGLRQKTNREKPQLQSPLGIYFEKPKIAETQIDQGKSEFSQKINLSLGTIRIWDKNGKLPAKRLASGHRYYTEEDLNKALNLEPPEIKKKQLFIPEFHPLSRNKT